MALKNKNKKKIRKRKKIGNNSTHKGNAQTQQKIQNNESTVVEYLAPSKIKVDYSSVAGIGVFALEDISKGEIVERCPMVRMEHRSNYVHDPTINNYMYTQPKCPCKDCQNHGYFYWMVLGYGMLYNHQDIPTTDWKFNYNLKYADVVAKQDIKKGDEIFVTYGSNYFRNRKQTLDKNRFDNIESTLENMDNDNDFLNTVTNYIETVKSKEQTNNNQCNIHNTNSQQNTQSQSNFRPWNK